MINIKPLLLGGAMYLSGGNIKNAKDIKNYQDTTVGMY